MKKVLIWRFDELDGMPMQAVRLTLRTVNMRGFGEVQRLAVDGNVTKERKEKLYADRQRALWGLFALLCLRGQLDEIERLQRAVFEQRIVMLEEYYANLTAQPFPTGRRRA